MIEQIVMNLAVNARDAMERGGQLALSAEAVEIDEAGKCPDRASGFPLVASSIITASALKANWPPRSIASRALTARFMTICSIHPQVRGECGPIWWRSGIARRCLRHQPLQHSADVADYLVKLERLGLHHLLAAEGQQLPGQVCGPLCRSGNLFECVRRFLAHVLIVLEHGRITQNDAEDVVEVVATPADNCPTAASRSCCMIASWLWRNLS